jgi:hypothetical protein
MNTLARRGVAVVGAVAAATTLVTVAPAQSATVTPSTVTVRSTDYTPAAGQTFRLYGAVWAKGHRVPATIRVKTYFKGEWVQLKGAVMSTNRDNTYRMRIILHLKGRQLLRVVGDPKPAGIATSRKTIAVWVH